MDYICDRLLGLFQNIDAEWAHILCVQDERAVIPNALVTYRQPTEPVHGMAEQSALNYHHLERSNVTIVMGSAVSPDTEHLPPESDLAMSGGLPHVKDRTLQLP
jgi:hypothetical protein